MTETPPGIYLVNATGEMTPLVTERDDGKPRSLYEEAISEHIHDYRCPSCGATIRSTGGGEALYESEANPDKRKVVPHDLVVFSKVGVDEMVDYCWYCPNKNCHVWRLFPGDTND